MKLDETKIDSLLNSIFVILLIVRPIKNNNQDKVNFQYLSIFFCIWLLKIK